MRILYFLAIVFFFCTACTESAPKRNIIKQNNIPKIDTILYEVKTISKEFGDCKTENGVCSRAKVTYAVIKDAPNKAAISIMNKGIEKVLKEDAPTIEASLDSFLNEAKIASEEMPEYFRGHSIELDQVVRLNDGNLLIIEEDMFSFTGGAHGIYGTIFYNFDVNTGKQLGINDLLKAGYEPVLEKLIEASLKKQYLQEDMETLADAGFMLENDKLNIPDNFAITKTGLKFVYNPYEIAPYVMGQQVVDIPFEQVKEWIKSNSILHKK